MPLPSEAHRLLAERLLFDGEPSPETPGAAVRHVQAALVRGVAPVLGAEGLQALLVRSIRLVRADVPPLAALLGPDKPTPDMDHFASSLDQLPRELGRNVAIALYATLLALLVTFVGDSLTEHLVKAAFPALGNTRPKGTT